MVLLSHMIRTAAITGRTDTINAWFAGRQGGRWAQQMVRAAVPTAVPRAEGTGSRRADPAETVRELTDLRRRGVLTGAEFESLRADLRV